MQNKKLSSGVSLVELAIVIVIIGLLVTVVVGSNSMVKEAKIRKVVHEIQTIETSYRAFQTTYDAIPGDMIDAYEYFGANCASAATLCNGDGNGDIEGFEAEATASNNNDDLEYLRLFLHLRLAGIYEGDYSGTGVTSVDNFDECTNTDKLSDTCIRAPGYNVPKTIISTQAYYTVHYDSEELDNVINLGATNTNGTKYTAMNVGAAITPSDNKLIDAKLDDGLPSSGSVRANNGKQKVETCLTSDNYDETNTGINCVLRYILR